jgi:hypothetical protein
MIVAHLACMLTTGLVAGEPVGPVPPVVTPTGVAVAEWSRLRGRQRFGRRLTGGGFAGFGAAYIGGVAGGFASGVFGEDPGSIVAALPLAGPFVSAAWQDPGAAGWKAFFVVDGLAQVGTLALGISGLVIQRRAGRALGDVRFAEFDLRLARRLDEDPDLVRRGRLGMGLMVGGLSGFGVAYIATATAFMSAESEALVTSREDVDRLWAVVPLVGPWVVAGQADLAGTRALAGVLGVLQVGSLATGIAGAAIRGRRARDGEARVVRDVSVAPWQAGRGLGVLISGRF